jgi:hypothetical protein
MALLLFSRLCADASAAKGRYKEERTMTVANPDQPQPKPSNVVPMAARPAQPPPPDHTAAPPGAGRSDETHTPDEPGYGHGV